MTTQETLTTNKKRMIIILSVVTFILSIPLVAMQFTNEVDWKLSDFVIMGTLLLLTGLGIELVIRKVKSKNLRIAICITILFLLFLIWAELAVGIFGSPFAGS